MRFKLMVILMMFVTGISCSGNYNKNEVLIQSVVAAKEADKGFKHIKITGHKQSTYSIMVFVEAVDSLNKQHADTINFTTTGDGFIIQ